MKLPNHVVMNWEDYLDLARPEDRQRRVQKAQKAWGRLPRVVEIKDGELLPIWDDDPRFGNTRSTE
jgi:hypothetical protein